MTAVRLKFVHDHARTTRDDTVVASKMVRMGHWSSIPFHPEFNLLIYDPFNFRLYDLKVGDIWMCDLFTCGYSRRGRQSITL